MFRINLRHFSYYCLLFALSSGPVFALPEDSNQPIYISSDSAIKDDKSGLTIYEGDVNMTQGSLKIKADKITIYSDTEQVTKVIAKGKPAHFQQQPEPEKEDVIAKAETIEYKVTQERITLTQNAYLDQNGDIIKGDKIDYDLIKSRVEADGRDNRVNVVIQPQGQQN